MTTWAIARLGLRGTLTGLPATAILGGAAALVASLALGSYHPAVFWMLTGLYLADCCLDHAEAAARRIAARAVLRKARITAAAGQVPFLLVRGAADLALLLDLRAALTDPPLGADRALATALDHKILECRDGLVVLAAIRGTDPRLRAVRKALLVRDRSRLGYAIEALDDLLSRCEAQPVLPLIEGTAGRWSGRGVAELIDDILVRGTAVYSPWLVASVIRRLGRFAGHPDPVLARTAQWALASLDFSVRPEGAHHLWRKDPPGWWSV